MELQLLRIFKTIADEKNLTKAANSLNYVQSNISTRLKQLEEELDCSLFTRTKKGMILTQQGERLLPYAVELLNRESEIKNKMMNSKEVEHLSLGLPDSFVRTYLAKPITHWKKSHKSSRIRIKTGYSHQIVEWLENRTIDVGVVISKKRPLNYHIIQEFKSEFCVVAPKNITSLNRESLTGLQPMLLGDSCFFGQAIIQLYNDLGLFSEKNEYLFSIESILQCISLGLGASVLPKCLMQKHHMREKVQILEYPKSSRFSYFKICLKENKKTLLVNEMTEVLKSSTSLK